MFYVCIENNEVISVLNYEPSVPETVKIVRITDIEHKKISDQLATFDISTLKVVDLPKTILDSRETEKKNAVEREFLNSTDWMILRHIREKALNLPTTLTEQQYLDLEQKRNNAAARIL